MPDIASLTQTEAEERSRLLHVDRYDIAVDMRGLLEGETLRTTSTITFTCSEPGAGTFVDAGGEVTSATLNGEPLDVTVVDGRLPLPALAASNTLVVEMTQSDTGSGEGILRTVDPTDKLVYVWTSLEAAEAHKLWACFDQPDLKAPHVFTVSVPDTWLVTSNGAPSSVEDAPDGDGRVWTYPATPPLSTYVVVVNAGPFHEVRVQHDGYDLGFYCRQSLVPHLERDLDELVTVTRQGLAFFGERFGLPFPQERYDQVFVPNLGGAMENWGCVTYGDSQLFRTPPTHAQRETRAEFVLHEMAHMWFGDLVTMRWWDDLWLNEAFASWASCWALARATEFTDIWASFLAAYKRTAYEMDMSPAAHAIRGVVPDVSQAMANFDAITYVKGQSVLHQLMAFIGEDAFVEGLRAYFRRHQWGNTGLDDLMSAFGEAAGRDLADWTSAWLDRSGPDTLHLEGGTVTAEAPDGGAPRPHRFEIASYRAGDRLEPAGSTAVTLEGASYDVGALDGDLHLLNAGDLTYAVARPDETSLRLMLERIAELPDPLSRALVVGTAGQLLLRGELAPREAAAAATRALAEETAPALVEPFAAMAYAWADRWASAEDSPALKASLADACLGLADPDSGRPDAAQAALQTLAKTASTDKHWARLEQAMDDAEDHDLAWRVLARRAELGELDREAVDRLSEADPDPDSNVRRLMVLASADDAEAKEEVWRAFFTDHSVPASRDTLILGSMFWRPTQAALLEPFTYRYLEELGRLTGGLLNQGVVIRAMYPAGVGDAAFADAAEAAADAGEVSKYAQAQLRSSTFVLRRTLEARTR